MPGNENRTLLAEYLSFDRIIAAQSLRLVYWVGLGLIALVPLSAIGAGVGIAIHDFPIGILPGIAGIIVGLLIGAALVVLWRAFCEFFAAILRIAEDIRAIRESQERDIFRR